MDWHDFVHTFTMFSGELFFFIILIEISKDVNAKTILKRARLYFAKKYNARNKRACSDESYEIRAERITRIFERKSLSFIVFTYIYIYT